MVILHLTDCVISSAVENVSLNKPTISDSVKIQEGLAK